MHTVDPTDQPETETLNHDVTLIPEFQCTPVANLALITVRHVLLALMGKSILPDRRQRCCADREQSKTALAFRLLSAIWLKKFVRSSLSPGIDNC